MDKIRVTKKFRFEMAHMLPYHKGLCKNLHGHSYELDVTVRGKVLQKPGNPADGMVMDFSLLKNLVEEVILSRYDHSVTLHESTGKLLADEMKVNYTSCSPTSEVLLMEFVRSAKPVMPDGVELAAIKLSETSTSYAEWKIEDNEK